MNVYGSIGGDGDAADQILLHDQLQRGQRGDATGGDALQPSQSNPVVSTDCCFRDGIRKIDFVLVYEEELCDLNEHRAAGNTEDLGKSLVDKAEIWRQKFKTNLLRNGVHIEEERVENPKKMIYYYKVHIPGDVLCIYAEDLLLRAPLQAKTTSNVNWTERVLSSCKLPNIMRIDVPNQPQHFYTCQFKRSKMNRFLGGKNANEMFCNRDRQRIAYEILARTVYGDKSRAEIGIDRLLDEGIYAAAYPLHDV